MDRHCVVNAIKYCGSEKIPVERYDDQHDLYVTGDDHRC